jgi:hypothetical protein
LYLGRSKSKVTAKQATGILTPVFRKAPNVACNAVGHTLIFTKNLLQDSTMDSMNGNRKIDTMREYAKQIDWTPTWETGSPLPQVFSNGHKTFLTYLVNTIDPNWDGSYTTMIDNKSADIFPLCLVTFIRPHSHRYGIMNDEAANGHPLYSKGLQIYSAHIVENSTWIEELKTIHKAHPYYSDTRWTNRKHFLLFFHDEIFEIIAEDYKIEVFNSTFHDLAIEIASRLNS